LTGFKLNKYGIIQFQQIIAIKGTKKMRKITPKITPEVIILSFIFHPFPHAGQSMD
jgi:hypothetical protein